MHSLTYKEDCVDTPAVQDSIRAAWAEESGLSRLGRRSLALCVHAPQAPYRLCILTVEMPDGPLAEPCAVFPALARN